MGGMVEEGLKSNKIMSYSEIKANTQAIQNGTGGFRSNQDTKNERLQKKKKTFTPLEKSYTSLFHRLRQLGMLNPIKPKLPNPPPRNLDRSMSCEYCSGALGHDTEKCWQLKTAIQELIDTHRIEVQAPEAPNINHNLLPAHQETNMIEIVHKEGEPKKPSQTVMMIRSSESRPFERSTSEKSAIKLNGANRKPERAKVVVPGVANKPVVIVEGGHTYPVIIKPITQLPIVNSKAISWNYERVIVTYRGKEVLVENGSSTNTCPLSTLNRLKVLDVAVSYNLLLGRPWIHAAKAVPSTLHQTVKFEWDRQEIVVHGKDNLCVPSDVIALFIEFEDDKGPWVYQKDVAVKWTDKCQEAFDKHDVTGQKEQAIYYLSKKFTS
ncbi:uncharacterized protein [Nicotiana sylvestris]|uniref:uncharacterized protein n=1 Tax=Nicotiana sylvestris TaxID=4096 RepID=UPI00388C4B41